MQITLKGLPKVSLNQWYAGNHWTKRKKLKDTYVWLVKSQCKKVFPKDKQYKVRYDFVYKSRPLDSSNCIAQIKLLEDILFEDDKFDVVTELSISSRKGKEEFVTITIDEI